jgi:hypothetical protein
MPPVIPVHSRPKISDKELIDLPPHIISSYHYDYVTYTVSDIVGHEVKETALVTNAPCYMGSMKYITSGVFNCHPNVQFLISDEDYIRWMDLCKVNGLMPESSRYYIDKKGPMAHIPGTGENRHRVYSGLCCYRFVQSNAPLVYTALRLIETLPEVDFYQVLHYVMSKFVYNWNHNVSYLSTTGLHGAYGGSGSGMNLDLIHSIALKWWFKRHNGNPSICETHQKVEPANTGVHSYAIGLKVNFPITAVEECLNSTYTPLYNVATNDVDALKLLK